jgi:hypothetical protein
MSEKQIAIRVLLAAEKKGGNVQMGDIAYPDIEYALQRGWLVNVGTGHWHITDSCHQAAVD